MIEKDQLASAEYIETDSQWELLFFCNYAVF